MRALRGGLKATLCNLRTIVYNCARWWPEKYSRFTLGNLRLTLELRFTLGDLRFTFADSESSGNFDILFLSDLVFWGLSGSGGSDRDLEKS